MRLVTALVSLAACVPPPPPPLLSAPGAERFVAGDLDGDADGDLVLFGDGISIAWNEGGAYALAPLTRYITPPEIADVAVGDLDRDGDLDLAVARKGAGIDLIFNDGGGRFPRLELLDEGEADHRRLDLADVDGDGALDLVTAYGDFGIIGGESLTVSEQGVRVYRGRGDGGFDPPFKLLPDSLAARVAVVELGGGAGVAVVAALRGGIAVCSSGGVDFGPPQLLPLRVGEVAAGDFDGDGDRDLILQGERGGLTLARNEGGALSFEPASDEDASELAAGDFDGDGDDDLIVARRDEDNTGALSAKSLYLFFNDGGSWRLREIVDQLAVEAVGVLPAGGGVADAAVLSRYGELFRYPLPGD